MFVPVMQVRIMGMLVGNRIVGMKVRMPFRTRDCFTIMGMRMMPVVMMVIMYMLHGFMGMRVLMR